MQASAINGRSAGSTTAASRRIGVGIEYRLPGNIRIFRSARERPASAQARQTSRVEHERDETDDRHQSDQRHDSEVQLTSLSVFFRHSVDHLCGMREKHDQILQDLQARLASVPEQPVQ